MDNSDYRQTERLRAAEIQPQLATKVKSVEGATLYPGSKIDRILNCRHGDMVSGRYRIYLYRFLTDNIPIVNACLSTWVRLSAAPGSFRIVDDSSGTSAEEALRRLDVLSERIYETSISNPGSTVTFLAEMFSSLYRDGVCGGFLTVKTDGSGVDRFIPIDPADLRVEQKDNSRHLSLDLDHGTVELGRDDFYYIPLDADLSNPLGRSVLQAVPFVTFIEQQLVNDMRRFSHNAGFHRLHVKVTPPERMAGESDEAYIDRINRYFDSTVTMVKSCDVDDNPVTWDNVMIEHIGPNNVRTVTNSWFLNHRSMIEEICAGAGLAPFLLGYSYGATATWSAFKFDLVMRRVKSVQAQMSALLEWIGNIELSLAGLRGRCRFEFDNNFAYQALDAVQVQASRIDSLLKLFEAGLIDQSTARQKAGLLI